MESIEGKVILITGAGQGLGAATAKVLAGEKGIIIGADKKEQEVRNVAESIIQHNGNAEGIRLDVTSEEDINRGFDYILNKYKRIDVLINNAGIDATKSIEDLGISLFDKIIAVNLRAPFLLSKKAFPIMQQQGGGSIVNIASTAAKRAWANASAYHASKWGLLGLSHALHVEGREKKIRVSAVVAGGMQTPFILERFPDTPLDVLQDPKNVADVIKFILQLPQESVIPEVMILPMKETSWP